MIYLDASFFVFCNFDHSAKGQSARRILKQIVEGMQAITSSLALDELMWVVIKSGNAEVLRETVEDVYDIPNLLWSKKLPLLFLYKHLILWRTTT
ncbi:MAG: hypothetical protein HY673_25600 [Chloroflexi bacterium]|nr:hypothetical protein [Chloroflexota bacterium]